MKLDVMSYIPLTYVHTRITRAQNKEAPTRPLFPDSADRLRPSLLL